MVYIRYFLCEGFGNAFKTNTFQFLRKEMRQLKEKTTHKEATNPLLITLNTLKCRDLGSLKSTDGDLTEK